MNKEEFFLKMLPSESNQTYEMLKARGFLIFQNGNNYYLSDNSNSCDADYLAELLSKYNLGTLENRKVINSTDETQNYIAELDLNAETSFQNLISVFEDILYIGAEYHINSEATWSFFLNRIYGDKVPVRLLEPYVARYIKAVSACGIRTYCSCDGNHTPRQKIIIDCYNIFDWWHNWIYHNLVPTEYQSKRDTDGSIAFTKRTQYDEYYKLNKAAEWLYDNRLSIRKMKKDLRELVKGKIKIYKATEQECEDAFLSSLNQLMEERK